MSCQGAPQLIRVYTPKLIPLLRWPRTPTWSGNGTLFNQFVVPTPDVRVNVTLRILFLPDASGAGSYPFDTTGGSLLSPTLALIQGATLDHANGYVPTTDLVGTGPSVVATGQILPVSQVASVKPATNAFSLDVQAGQDAIIGQISTSYTGPGSGLFGMRVQLGVRYNAVVEMNDAEWREFLSKATPAATQPEQVAV